jgi:carnitine O-acetyltransferase
VLTLRSYRDPVVINVNYFFHFQDDRRRTKQTARAANIVSNALAFRDIVIRCATGV